MVWLIAAHHMFIKMPKEITWEASSDLHKTHTDSCKCFWSTTPWNKWENTPAMLTTALRNPQKRMMMSGGGGGRQSSHQSWAWTTVEKVKQKNVKSNYFCVVSCSRLLLPVAARLITQAAFQRLQGGIIRKNSFIYAISKTHCTKPQFTAWADCSVGKRRGDHLLGMITAHSCWALCVCVCAA